jgi:two-component system, OmpR family, phosphate regulon sensor histidine kinase PhoR
MKKRRTIRMAWMVLRGIGFVLVCLVAAWSVAFILTQWFYQLIHLWPNPYVQQIISSLLGIFWLGLAGSLFGRVARRRHIDMWKAMIDAMKQIAKGNFNVNLKVRESDAKGPNRYGELVETINEMASELQQLERMRQEFISNVSHELQSPLTSIRGFAKVLHQENLSPNERLHYLDIIENESMRLSKLSENLLKLTALESEHPTFDPVTYRLDRQLRNIVLACEPHWIGKEMTMDVSLDEVMVHADEDLMSQVWVNVIHNGIKFTPQGGRMGVSLEQHGDSAVVMIRDSGIGIAKEDKARIFERFYKADPSRNRSAGGSGLGLSIVKKIVEMHHGVIDVESVRGEGTTFTVQFPLEQK